MAHVKCHAGPDANHQLPAAVAHVRDEASGKWWRFDDETVTEMPQGPIGEKGDHGGGAPAAAPASKKSAAGKWLCMAPAGAAKKGTEGAWHLCGSATVGISSDQTIQLHEEAPTTVPAAT